MQKVKKKRFMILFALAALFVAMISMGVVMAILAKTVESRANKFTFSNADIALVEPDWPEDPEKRIVYPGAVVPKNPMVKNTGSAAMYMYLMVKTPTASNIKVVETNSEGRQIVETADEPFDLMTYEEKAGWYLLFDSKKEEDKAYREDGYHVRLYAYGKPVAAGGETPALFDNVTFSEYILEGEPGIGQEIDMPITAYAVQSDYLDIASGEIEDTLKRAFELYSKQAASDKGQ